MNDLDRTVRFHNDMPSYKGQIVTVFDGTHTPWSVSLSDIGNSVVTFGRTDHNDIVLSSPLVSHYHGSFICSGGKWYIHDNDSTNGLIYNNKCITDLEISDGDFVRIDDGVETVVDGVLFVFHR